MTLQSPLTTLTGVGDKVADKLAVLGLFKVEDLIYYYPRRYEDYTNPRLINQLVIGQEQIIKAEILEISNDISARQRIKITKAQVSDQSGSINLVWFNQPFLPQTLKVGTSWLFSGKLERDFQGKLTMVSPKIERDARILPVYGETIGLSSKIIRKLIFQIRHLIHDYADWLEDDALTQNNLIAINQALEIIHFPDSIAQISSAKRRLAFDEIFILLVKINRLKLDLSKTNSPVCKGNLPQLKSFIKSLPFKLTDSQRLASWEIIKDLALTNPMNRLLEGDVGSGKTIVGLIAALTVIQSGFKVVWMAPTEILARQHWESCERFLSNLNIKCALLTSATTKKIALNLSQFDLVIGTQAVIQDKVHFQNLGLIIVDEQHRFGVKQRNKLIENQSITPHFLAMTATPIPRTLALTIYGDLSISALRSIPTGRLPIISRLINQQNRIEAYNLIRAEIKKGRQAFVVCPLIDETNKELLESANSQLDFEIIEKKAAVTEYEKLAKHIFPDLKVGLIHGKLKSAEKELVMSKFASGQLDILVATAVIEVGIDIPNASVMMIENADRFGLAQLHQFRGRVGRGIHQSYCFVFTETQNPNGLERLQAFTSSNSGFDLAELDLKLRGPGQMTGLIQAGLTDLKLASLNDIDLIRQAKALLDSLAKSRGPSLTKIMNKIQESDQLAQLG